MAPSSSQAASAHQFKFLVLAELNLNTGYQLHKTDFGHWLVVRLVLLEQHCFQILLVEPDGKGFGKI